MSFEVKKKVPKADSEDDAKLMTIIESDEISNDPNHN